MINRQEANRRIVMYLFDMIEKYPQLRFSQIMASLEVVIKEKEDWKDEFYLEPSQLLERVELAAEKLLKNL